MIFLNLLRIAFTTDHLKELEKCVNQSINTPKRNFILRTASTSQNYSFAEKIELKENKLNSLLKCTNSSIYSNIHNNIDEYIRISINFSIFNYSSKILSRSIKNELRHFDQSLTVKFNESYFFNLNKILTLIYYIMPSSFVQMMDIGTGYNIYFLIKDKHSCFKRYELLYYFNPSNFILKDWNSVDFSYDIISEEVFTQIFNLFTQYLNFFNDSFSSIVFSDMNYYKKYTLNDDFRGLMGDNRCKSRYFFKKIIMKNSGYVFNLLPEMSWLFNNLTTKKLKFILTTKMHSIFSVLLSNLFSI